MLYFDSCQGEERDIIYYSFVGTAQKDRLCIFPQSITEQDEEELDRDKKMQDSCRVFERKNSFLFILKI